MSFWYYMSFAGHVFDMINRFKQNRSLLKTDKQKENYKKTFLSLPDGRKFVNDKKLSKEKRREIIHRIQAEQDKEQKKKILSLIITLIIVFLLVYYFNKFLNPS